MIIALADITADQRAQPRSAILVDKVNEFTEDMERGDKFPPVAIFREGKVHWLADGFHRYYAAVAAGAKTIDCAIKDGTLRDAVLFSCSANAAHGLRRTNLDKRRAAAKLLEDEEWSKWSDHEIARHCAVSHDFVRRVRKEVATFSPALNASDGRSYVTKHGTEATMKPARAERPKVPEGAVIAKWLKEIERLYDKMPDAVAAVTNFPQDQHYLFPLSKLEEMAAWFGEFATSWRDRMRADAHERST